MNRRRAIILAVCGALLAGGAWYFVRSSSRQAPEPSLRELLPAIAEGQSDAALRARSAAASDWPGSLPVLVEMLSADNWRLRAVACEVVSARADGNLVVLLIPRASDADWHVRSAAFEALSRVRPLGGPTPMTNTPLAQREEVLLSWIEGGKARSYQAEPRSPVGNVGPWHPDSRSSADVGPWHQELCEIYANAAHVELGGPMIDRCLNCHAGASPQPFEAGGACARCHPAIYQQWAGSAHANSLSHVHLVTVDPTTRTPQVVDFGAVRGIGCAECHSLDPPGQTVAIPAATKAATAPSPATSATASPGADADEAATSQPASASRPIACPYRFWAARPAGDSCARCHASTYEEWRTWQSRPHPTRLDWPPGQIDMEARGDRRGCADCHMPPRGLVEADRPKDHAWSARRAPDFLREGVEVGVVPAGGEANRLMVQLRMTNLAGHDFPTGSRRRAVRLYADAGGAQEDGLLATLSPDRPGQLFLDAQPSLAPGESRLFPVALPAGASAVRCQLRYYRNLADPNGYTVDFLASQEAVRR